MIPKEITLCSPDGRKTCFACCPPIRPAGYEHIQYKGSVQRILRENTKDFERMKHGVHAITGFSCWALGYLDRDHRRIGCLLHPARNQGHDLRYRVGFDDKCRRETCPEAETFSRLGNEKKAFWLGLTENLDSFSYSSRTQNPLFRLMGWGTRILDLIAETEAHCAMKSEYFSRTYPFFATTLFPKAHAYILHRLVDRAGPSILRSPGFRDAFEDFCKNLSSDAAREAPPTQEGTPVFRLDLDDHFRDTLRLFLGRTRLPLEAALRLKAALDDRIDTFYHRIQGS
ncbi:MAG: hypothetical protein ACOWYE_12505 [Desulfatiglandales bacterium]